MDHAKDIPQHDDGHKKGAFAENHFGSQCLNN